MFTIDNDTLDAVHEFSIRTRGDWKEDLITAWTRASEPGLLQRLRNTSGAHEWLRLYRRPLFVIAEDIEQDWGRKVNYAARPYLTAMAELDGIEGMFHNESARSVVRYFLANASSWRGEKAKAVKAELRGMIGK